MESLPAKFGDYVLEDRIGAGGMAEIFLASEGGGEAKLVIKRILPQLTTDDQFVNMFVEEARLCVALRHPNIVEVFDLGQADDQYFIAMEYVHGRDLLKTLAACAKKRIPFPTDLALYIVMEVLKGLDYAHNLKGSDSKPLGIIHRDVSPSNVLLSFDGKVKIGDFGIAKASTREKTATGILKGKFGYMAPEQVRGKPLDHRADVFAVGILLYELLTGHRLFAAKSDIAILEKVRDAIIDPLPRHYRPDLSLELERIVLKALALEASDRYRSGAELHAALDEYTRRARVQVGPKVLARFMHELFVAGDTSEQQKVEKGKNGHWEKSPNTSNERVRIRTGEHPTDDSQTHEEDEPSAARPRWTGSENETQERVVEPQDLEEETSEHTEIAADPSRALKAVKAPKHRVFEEPSRPIAAGIDPSEAVSQLPDRVDAADRETRTENAPKRGAPVKLGAEEIARSKIQPPSARLRLDERGDPRGDEAASPWESGGQTFDEVEPRYASVAISDARREVYAEVKETVEEPIEAPENDAERTDLLGHPRDDDHEEETSAIDRRDPRFVEAVAQVRTSVPPSFDAAPDTLFESSAPTYEAFEAKPSPPKRAPSSRTEDLEPLPSPSPTPEVEGSDPWPVMGGGPDPAGLAREAARLPSSALRPFPEDPLPADVVVGPPAKGSQETVRLATGSETFQSPTVELDDPPDEKTNFGRLIEEPSHLPRARAANLEEALDESQRVEAEVKRLQSVSTRPIPADRTVGGDLAGLLGVSISEIISGPEASEPVETRKKGRAKDEDRPVSETRIGRLDDQGEKVLSGALSLLDSSEQLRSFDPYEESSLEATGTGDDHSLEIGMPVALDPPPKPAPAKPKSAAEIRGKRAELIEREEPKKPRDKRAGLDEPTAAIPENEPPASRAQLSAIEDTRLRPAETSPPIEPDRKKAPPPVTEEEDGPDRKSAAPRMTSAAERRLRAVVERMRPIKEANRPSAAPQPPRASAAPAPARASQAPQNPGLVITADLEPAPPMVPTATALYGDLAQKGAQPQGSIPPTPSMAPLTDHHQRRFGTDMRIAMLFAIFAVLLVGMLFLLRSRGTSTTEPLEIAPTPTRVMGQAAVEPAHPSADEVPTPEQIEQLLAESANPSAAEEPAPATVVLSCKTPMDVKIGDVGTFTQVKARSVPVPVGPIKIELKIGKKTVTKSLEAHPGESVIVSCP